jgi:hypothetical protein
MRTARQILALLCWPCTIAAHAKERAHTNTTHEAGWSSELRLDYDSSRARTSPLHLGCELEWGNAQTWISLTGDLYSNVDQRPNLQDDGYLTLQLGHALYRDNEQRLYINAMLDLEPHSILAEHGWDITPKLGLAWGITEDWWIGGEAAAILATHADDGNRTGYPSLSLWVNWLCGFTTAETDTLALSLWVAGNEIPDDDNALFLELEYTFDITEQLEASIGLGTDPISPWDHLGLYASAGLKYRF